MQNVKYKVLSYHNKPVRVEISKETEKSVWIKGYGQCRKFSDSWQFYDTLEDAKKAIIERNKENIEYHESQIYTLLKKIKELECFDEKDLDN